MPIYSFDIRKNGARLAPEHELQLADIDAAWEEATITCGQMIKDLDGSLEPGTEWSIEIKDEFQNPLRTLSVQAKAFGQPAPKAHHRKTQNS